MYITLEYVHTKTLCHISLFKRRTCNVKDFVGLMHDAVIRFYKLDVKVGVQHMQNANLINLLTSIVLRNPVYSEVHSLIRLIHKPQYKKIIQTIEKVRTKHNLEEELSINQLDIGMALLKNKTREDGNSQLLDSEISLSTEFKHLE